MFILNLIIVTSLLSSISTNARQNQNSGLFLDRLKMEIEENYYLAEESIYRRILQKLDSLKEIEKDNERVFYYAGFVQIQLGRIIREKNNGLAADLFMEAIEDLEVTNEINPFDESMALLSSAYGKLASISIFKAIWYGSSADDFLKKARLIMTDNNSSKLNLVEATHHIFTPEAFGGDKKRANDLLLKALNKKHDLDDKLIEWAQPAEIYAYLAQLEIEKENYVEARAYSQKALNIEPHFSFVINELLPVIKENTGNQNED